MPELWLMPVTYAQYIAGTANMPSVQRGKRFHENYEHVLKQVTPHLAHIQAVTNGVHKLNDCNGGQDGNKNVIHTGTSDLDEAGLPPAVRGAGRSISIMNACAHVHPLSIY